LCVAIVLVAQPVNGRHLVAQPASRPARVVQPTARPSPVAQTVSRSNLMGQPVSPPVPALDLQKAPRLLHEVLELPGGIRPAQMRLDIGRFAAETEFVTVNRGYLVVAPFLMQRVLGLERGEYLQLRLTHDSVRLELRMSWR
jgi:hypothetical protein